METVVQSSSQIIVTLVEDPVTVIATESSIVSTDTETLSTVTNTENNNVVVEVPTTTILVAAGAQGPQGPPGPSGGEEDVPYAKQTDFVTDDLIYRGEAAVGSLTSASAWRIRKLVIGVDGDVSETWADGNANFDNVWDNRLSLSYS